MRRLAEIFTKMLLIAAAGPSRCYTGGAACYRRDRRCYAGFGLCYSDSGQCYRRRPAESHEGYSGRCTGFEKHQNKFLMQNELPKS
jgi:hypothetical protein